MARRRVTVGWPEGLHARPASVFVRSATSLGVPVTVGRPDDPKRVNAASMLGVLSLGVGGGQEVELASEAPDADAALDRLARLVSEGLDTLPDA